jgi:hypothetical protein
MWIWAANFHESFHLVRLLGDFSPFSITHKGNFLSFKGMERMSRWVGYFRLILVDNALRLSLTPHLGFTSGFASCLLTQEAEKIKPSFIGLGFWPDYFLPSCWLIICGLDVSTFVLTKWNHCAYSNILNGSDVVTHHNLSNSPIWTLS